VPARAATGAGDGREMFGAGVDDGRDAGGDGRDTATAGREPSTAAAAAASSSQLAASPVPGCGMLATCFSNVPFSAATIASSNHGTSEIDRMQQLRIYDANCFTTGFLLASRRAKAFEFCGFL